MLKQLKTVVLRQSALVTKNFPTSKNVVTVLVVSMFTSHFLGYGFNTHLHPVCTSFHML